MCVRLAEALGIDATRVSVKGKTNEGVDAVGRGEALASHAVALLAPSTFAEATADKRAARLEPPS